MSEDMEETPQHLLNFLKEREEEVKERRAKLKKGPNVVHLRYLAQHISPDELLGLEDRLKPLDLELSLFDGSGIPHNSISSLAADLVLTFTEPGLSGVLLSGLLTNTLYDGLKGLIIQCWHLVKGKPTVTLTSNTVIEHTTKFHVIIKNGDQTLEFKTENLSEQTIGPAIDRICQAVSGPGTEERHIFRFDEDAKLWKRVVVSIDYLKQPQEILREVPLDDYLEELRRKGSA